MSVHDYLQGVVARSSAGFLILLDPDRVDLDSIHRLVSESTRRGVDGFLVGSSLLMSSQTHRLIREIKQHSDKPAILFPGNSLQVVPGADAILFLSLISGRNPQYLISEQVKGAPLVRELGIEPIPTGYMLIESGTGTSVEFVSDTKPIPRDKVDIAMAHALAGEYLGMKYIYLEAGSGALQTVPNEMISAVREYVSVPLIVGGGIHTPEEASEKARAGASFVVIGTHLESSSGYGVISEFADAIHSKIGTEALR